MDAPQFFTLLTTTVVIAGTKLKMGDVGSIQILPPPTRSNFDIDGDNLVLGVVLMAGIISLLIRRK
jgi:hypothetical protein